MNSKERKPFPFQREVWKSIVAGDNGILHSPTGTGKTLAIWLGAIASWYEQQVAGELQAKTEKAQRKTKRVNRNNFESIQVIWLTPLRALAADTLLALQEPVSDLGLPWLVERRTSDTSSSVKTKQKNRLPSCLITTPESLSILLSYPKTQSQFSSLKLIVLDEWHELMGTKRGVQAELGLSRLRSLSPSARTWAVSATIGNVEQAMQTAIGCAAEQGGVTATVVKAPARRK